jgi:hypothetical protein
VPQDRVRSSSPESANTRIDEQIRERVRQHAALGPAAIDRRVEELDRSWDVERVLEANAATLAFTGTVLALTRSRRWLAVPAVVTGFLLQHAVQGWCPPIALFRRLGVRTREELDEEKYALMAVRGDFRDVVEEPDRALAAARS